jgi:hypothetical protein
MHKLQIGFFFILAYIETSAQNRIFVTIDSNQPPILSANAGADVNVYNENIVLGEIPTALGGIPPYEYQWAPETNLDNPSSPNPIYSGLGDLSFLVTVSDSRGCSASDSIRIIISGVEENNSGQSILVYPNPGHNEIFIKSIQNLDIEDYTVTITDESGKLVKSQNGMLGESLLKIEVSELSVGIYLLTYKSMKQNISRKIVIKR